MKVTQVGDSSVIAAQGIGNSLQFWWQPIGSRQWNQEVVAGAGSGAFSAPSVAQVGNSSVIAAQGIGNSLRSGGSPSAAGNGTESWWPARVAAPFRRRRSPRSGTRR